MKQLLLIFITCTSAIFNLEAQDRRKTGLEIKNSNFDLIHNKVASITLTEYFYRNRKSKLLIEPGKKIKTQIFDHLGRNIETIYFNDSTQKISARYKYFYGDSIGHSMYRIEHYNSKDSLESIKNAIEHNGQIIYIVHNIGVPCFGNYKFIYNKQGLIEEAIWYGPKKGIWANENMIPYYTTKLSYTYRP